MVNLSVSFILVLIISFFVSGSSYCIPSKIECKALCRDIYGCNNRYPAYDCRYKDQEKLSIYNTDICLRRCARDVDYAACANFCEQRYKLSRDCERYASCIKNNQLIIDECLADCITY